MASRLLDRIRLPVAVAGALVFGACLDDQLDDNSADRLASHPSELEMQLDIQQIDLRGVVLQRVALTGSELHGWHGPAYIDGSQLQGARITASSGTLRIEGIRRDATKNTMVDPSHQSNDDVWQYQLQTYDRRGWHNVCAGDGYGTLVEGTYACASSPISTCISHWGYKPWKSPTLASLHLACVDALRSQPAGANLDVYDSFGLNRTVYFDGYWEEGHYDSAVGAMVDHVWHAKGVWGDTATVGVLSRETIATTY